MVQERFLYLKEINLKQLLIFSLILSLNIASNEVLNKFNSLIKKDLYFSQEIETNTTDKSFSEGSIKRYGQDIEVIIEKPVREKYIIKNNEIEVYDYEFNQSQIFAINKNEMPVLDLLKEGVQLQEIQDLTDRSFKVNYNEKYIYIEILSDKSFFIAYNDNMNYKNIVTFTKSDL